MNINTNAFDNLLAENMILKEKVETLGRAIREYENEFMELEKIVK